LRWVASGVGWRAVRPPSAAPRAADRRRRLEDDFAVGDEEEGDAGDGAEEAPERGVLRRDDVVVLVGLADVVQDAVLHLLRALRARWAAAWARGGANAVKEGGAPYSEPCRSSGCM
jgi:hypothetical protein